MEEDIIRKQPVGIINRLGKSINIKSSASKFRVSSKVYGDIVSQPQNHQKLETSSPWTISSSFGIGGFQTFRNKFELNLSFPRATKSDAVRIAAGEIQTGFPVHVEHSSTSCWSTV